MQTVNKTINAGLNAAPAAVRQSYGRVIAKQTLVKRFYEIFIKSSPEVSRRFAGTDFKRQHDMLEHSLTMALLFAEGNNIAEQALSRIRETHNRHHYDISPHLYKLWMDSLIQAIAEHDQLFDEELEAQWREMLQLAVDYIIRGY